MNRDFLVVIPARFASTRLPGKPLLEFGGQPLLQHVYQSAVNSSAADVIIATDDERIKRVAQGFGARVVMTSAAHNSGTERVAETVTRLQCSDADVIVNVQGDELGLPPALIDQVAADLARHPGAAMSSLCAPPDSPRDLDNPNCVKVVTDAHGYALTFSRAAVPRRQPGAGTPATGYRHIGIYACTCGFFKTCTTLPACEPERAERLEQLRVLYHGYRIHVAQAVTAPGLEINTPEDAALARRRYGG